MKTTETKEKSNKLRRLLPILALVAGLATPVVAYASEFDCWDCKNTCQEFYDSSDSYCWSQYNSTGNWGELEFCRWNAYNSYSNCVGNCEAYVCQGY